MAGKGIVLQDTLLKDAEMKTFVEKFAQDPKAFNESFSKAFLKMVSLGHNEEELSNVESLLEDHPYKKYINMYYWAAMG